VAGSNDHLVSSSVWGLVGNLSSQSGASLSGCADFIWFCSCQEVRRKSAIYDAPAIQLCSDLSFYSQASGLIWTCSFHSSYTWQGCNSMARNTQGLLRPRIRTGPPLLAPVLLTTASHRAKPNISGIFLPWKYWGWEGNASEYL